MMGPRGSVFCTGLLSVLVGVVRCISTSCHMGCCGSKGRASKDHYEAPPEPHLQVAPDLAEAGTFKVDIYRTKDGQALGLVVEASEDDEQSLVVRQVNEDGLVACWNRANEATPECRVQPGDVLLSVNTRSESVSVMTAELLDDVVVLLVKPGHRDASAAVSPTDTRRSPAETQCTSSRSGDDAPIVTCLANKEQLAEQDDGPEVGESPKTECNSIHAADISGVGGLHTLIHEETRDSTAHGRDPTDQERMCNFTGTCGEGMWNLSFSKEQLSSFTIRFHPLSESA
eukprot:TRINITY_DN28205_c0_g3_i1.p1 TRINITY_DN28205_c0_g3~~TRINITY_DN28205_c0_g3_i1.p1  ORF type:complete len:286 (+),score=42.04 TRINITY_DN28205_c0_g3_i1:119-976(+)